MNIPQELMYTKEHEWVKIDGNKVTVGITDYAQQQLGDIVFVELPTPEDEFGLGDSFAVLESVKAAADVYSPLVGTVIEANEGLDDDPALVNSEPYGDGWLVTFELADGEEIPGLMSPDEYAKFLAEQE